MLQHRRSLPSITASQGNQQHEVQETSTRSTCLQCNGLNNLRAFAVPYCSCIHSVVLGASVIQPSHTSLQEATTQKPPHSSQVTSHFQTSSVSSFNSSETQSIHSDGSESSGKRHQEQVPSSDALASKRPRSNGYVDHANDPLAAEYSPITSATFPFILHTLLNEVEEIGMSSIISFLPHGRAFKVHNPAAFVEHVMKLYFQQSQMTSFIRQLNLYSFRKLNSGPDSGAYYHEYFLRTRIDLCVYIHRTKVKGGKALSLPLHDPDFYQMPFVGVPKTAKKNAVVKEKEQQANLKDPDEGSTQHGSTSAAPATSATVNDQVSDAMLQGLVPRPLPPLFDDATLDSVQIPGTAPSTSVMDIADERWVFHVSSSRVGPAQKDAVEDSGSDESIDDSIFCKTDPNASANHDAQRLLDLSPSGEATIAESLFSSESDPMEERQDGDGEFDSSFWDEQLL